MRVVLDTNIVVSALLSPSGAPAKVLAGWEGQLFDLVVSEPLLAEYRRALLYRRVTERLGMSPADVDEIVQGFRQFAFLVEPQEVVTVVEDDPEDNKVLECALAGDAAYIVTGDSHLLKLQVFTDIQILSPSSFLEVLYQDGGT